MKRTDSTSFAAFLDEIGVARGDLLMVHSFLPSLGELPDGMEGLYRALWERVGPSGTLVVPTFTYSFCRGEEFDARTSPSTVGAFTEFVRRQAGAVRSLDPVFSIAAVGAEAAEVTRIREPVCFGPGSVFELLERGGVKFLLVGIDYQKSLTYFLHLERLAAVPYREDKRFAGTIVDQAGRRTRAEFTYCVRKDPEAVRMDYNRFGSRFDRTGSCRLLRFAYGAHRLFAAADLKPFVMADLAADPYCLTRLAAADARPIAADLCW